MASGRVTDRTATTPSTVARTSATSSDPTRADRPAVGVSALLYAHTPAPAEMALSAVTAPKERPNRPATVGFMIGMADTPEIEFLCVVCHRRNRPHIWKSETFSPGDVADVMPQHTHALSGAPVRSSARASNRG